MMNILECILNGSLPELNNHLEILNQKAEKWKSLYFHKVHCGLKSTTPSRGGGIMTVRAPANWGKQGICWKLQLLICSNNLCLQVMNILQDICLLLPLI